jgi:hypothetical protein
VKPKLLPVTKVGEIKKKKRFLITSAVNDTGLVTQAHATFKKLCKSLDACYLIIPGVYKNPDLKHQGVLEQITWPSEIEPYICNRDVKLCKNLVIRAETRIQYTAVNPLSGMNHAGNIKSEIYGHPQVALESVPTAHAFMPKKMYTTGTISKKNYGGSKTAKKAEFHHSISALFVEIEGDNFWATQVHFDGEGAQLFNKYYTPKKTKKGKIAAIIYGDTHKYSLPKKTEMILDGITKVLKPEYQVFHDLHDHHIGSHHTQNNTCHNLRLSKKRLFSIRDELDMSVDFLQRQPNPYVIDSNHDRHLDQWFNRFKPNGGDHVNLELYYELGSLMLQDTGNKSLFQLYVEKHSKAKVTFITDNTWFAIRNIDCSQHGHKGPNGARGSARAFSRTGHKTFIGHTHSDRIEKGCYQVGVSHAEAEYASGYGSWSETHGFIYDNGKRGLFSIVNGKLSPIMRRLK